MVFTPFISRLRRCAGLGGALAAFCFAPCCFAPCCFAPCRAADPAPAGETRAPAMLWKIGFDNYLGTSNAPGYRRSSDGIWIGSNAAFPSSTYLRWEDGKGSAARLAFGVGSDYTGSSSTLHQPMEAWWQQPVGGKSSLTVGKYWVPFALQEWEYETKPGAMVQWADRGNTMAVSVNLNEFTHVGNTYLRFGRSVAKSLNVGISLGVGKGLTYSTEHDRGWAVDGTWNARGWQMTAEYEEFLAPGAKRFSFAFGKLAYNNLGAWKPYVGLYQWRDGLEALGQYRSAVVGLGYQLTPNLILEGGYAPQANEIKHQVSWLQVHSSWER